MGLGEGGGGEGVGVSARVARRGGVPHLYSPSKWSLQWNSIFFFLRGVLFSRGTTEFDLGRLSRHASEGFLRFIFFKVT